MHNNYHSQTISKYPKESNGNQDQTEPPRSSLSPPQLVIGELAHFF
jgi:hypothetical protein